MKRTEHLCACGQPAPDATICRHCTSRTRRLIIDLPALADDLQITLARQDRVQAPSDGGHSAAEPWPISVAASEQLGRIKHTLVGWTLLLRDEYGIRLPADTIPALAVHLHELSATWRQHEAAQDLVDEMHQLHRDGRKVIDQPENRTKITVGPCPEVSNESDGTLSNCPGQVVAIVPADETISPRMECPACDRTWSSIEWNRAGQRILSRRAELDAQRRIAATFARRIGT